MAEGVELEPEGAVPRRDVTAWLRGLAPAAAEVIPDDATDTELLDGLEVLHRTRAELDLHRADLLARLWDRARAASADDEAVLREVAMISGVSMAAAERMLATSIVLRRGLTATRERLLEGVLPWSHVEVIADGVRQVQPCDVERYEAEAIRVVTGAGIGQAKDRVRRLIDRLNPEEMTERHQREYAERDVTLHPGANGMPG